MKTLTAVAAVLTFAAGVCSAETLIPKTAKVAAKPAMTENKPSAPSYADIKTAFSSAKAIPSEAELTRWLKGVLIYEDSAKAPQGVLLIGQLSGADKKKLTVNKMEYEPLQKYDAGLPDYVVGGILEAMKALNENPSVCAASKASFDCVWTDGVNKEIIRLRKNGKAILGEIEYTEQGQTVRSYLSCAQDVTPKL